MKTTYEHFDNAFAGVKAYVILDSSGDYVARVAFKHPRGNSNRLWCYFQAWGAAMVRGYAGGGGYDKRSAAMYDACRKYLANSGRTPVGEHIANVVCGSVDGIDWSRSLEDAGFRVLHVFG